MTKIVVAAAAVAVVAAVLAIVTVAPAFAGVAVIEPTPTPVPTTCQPITLANGTMTMARRTTHGWNTISCELQITIRLTDRVKTFKVQPGTTSMRCTVWVNDRNGTADLVPAAWDACLDATLEKAEAQLPSSSVQ